MGPNTPQALESTQSLQFASLSASTMEGRREVYYDLHATMLYLLGLDHERTTFRFSSRDMRLTDVHGRVLHDLLV